MGRFASLLTVCCALLACGCGSPEREPAPAGRADPADFKVLTYNIRHGEGMDGIIDLERIAAVIRDAAPDVVALQEVDSGVARSGGVDQAETLGELTGMAHAFAPFMEYQGGEYGLAVLSAHPIVSTRAIQLPPGRHEPRAALAVGIALPEGPPLTIVCLHLDWLEDDSERFAQAEALIGALEGPSAAILAGDFNDTPGSRTIGAFEAAGFLAAEPQRSGAETFPADLPRTRIDYIMHRPSFAFVAEAETLGESVASDHRPVLGRFWWGRPPSR
ncbi:MAG: endonuclease/exonuclease/phosphatase family protein [Phycisphaerales bacterium]|nr:endonuclease/exonuclease/phosphatase family protein [Phycisphaerales bacterium]